MNKFKLLILTNDIPGDHLKWIAAIENYKEFFDYKIVNIFSHNWYDLIIRDYFDFILAKPPGLKSLYKQIYDERLQLLPRNFQKILYPTLTEIKIYENKRYLSDWLKINNIPHPETFVFLDQFEAERFLNNCKFPIVAKTNIGASGKGVRIIKNKKQAEKYLKKAFSNKGAPHSYGPNFKVGSIFSKLKKIFNEPETLQFKLEIYKSTYREKQKGYVIFQDFIEHDFEWRVVVIGDSYFAHKKLKIGDKASGSLLKNYDNPPLYLFDFAKDIMERFGFYSQAIDLFQTKDGQLLVNEMQCMFGQSDPYQMLVDGKPGRYRFLNNKWVFEEGDFAKNECFDLRIEHILEILNQRL